METSLNITRIERPDDIPLLLAQMQKMDVAALLDEHFPTHGNWGGENIFYKNDPAFNPCIDCFLFTYQKLEKKHKNTIFLA